MFTFHPGCTEEGERERNRNPKADIQERDLNRSSPTARVRKGALGKLPTPGTGLAGIRVCLRWDWEGEVVWTSCLAQSQGGWADRVTH